MKASLIEKLDKSRYNLTKWSTIGWAIWFGGFILKDLIENKLILGLILLVGLFGSVIWTINLIRLQKLGKIINADINLKNALSDELFLHNRNKSFIVAYCTTIVLVTIFLVLSIYTDITALIVCEITLYISILSTLISSLIFNKA